MGNLDLVASIPKNALHGRRFCDRDCDVTASVFVENRSCETTDLDFETDCGPADNAEMPLTSSSITDSTSATNVCGGPMVDNNSFFRHALLEAMREGVVFVDNHCRIQVWNRNMEAITGVGKTAIGQTLSSAILQLRNLDQELVTDQHSLYESWVREQQPFTGHFIITGMSGRQTDVELLFHPVKTADGKPLGGIILLQDTSMQNDLQRQLNALQTIATIDPLTQVGNRAEFERLLDEYVRTHKQVGLKCSIIIGDLDYFKKINDTWGHHIGDHALVAFAQLLKMHVRGRDFVARYGGEEFVILCANCDEDAASDRADIIRRELGDIAQPMMQGQKMTASFGVTELQVGDDPTSLFVRADKALMWAKQTGRNRVVISGREPQQTDNADIDEEMRRNAKSISGAVWPEHGRPPTYSVELAAPDLLPIFVEKLKAWTEETRCKLDQITDGHMLVSLNQADPDNPKVTGLVQVEIDLLQTVEIERPSNLPDGTRVVLRVSTFGRPTLWKKIDFEKLGQAAVARLRNIVGLKDEKFLVKWPVRRKDDTRRYK